MYARMNPIRPVALNNDGSSFAKALGWTDVCTSGTGPANVFVGFDWDTWQNLNKYYAVALTGSTEYTFSGIGAYSKAKFTIYNMAGTKVAENNGQWLDEEPWYDMPALVWTPTTTGVYILMVSHGGEMPDGEDTYATSISPRPATHTREGFTPYGSSTGFDELRRLIRTRSAMASGLVAIPLSAPVGLTANDSDPKWVVSASSSYNEYTLPHRAFSGSDGSDGQNRWMTSESREGWISWRNLNRKVLVRNYSLNSTPEVGCEGRSPKQWTLEGSDDGETWTVLHTVTEGFGSSNPPPYQLMNYIVPSGNSAYYYHRLNITYTHSGEGYLSVGQIRAWST